MPMRLLRLQDAQAGPYDRVFRHARMRALIVWLAGFAVAIGLLYRAMSATWVPGYVFGPFVLLFLLLTFRFVAARFHESNWLVRLRDTGLFVQYRSYLNYGLSAADPSVVFIPLGEIASARLVKERLETPDTTKPGGTLTQFLRYVELELTGDVAPLASALGDERGESAPVEKHWYGSSTTLYRDYPVTIDTPPFVRIRWDVAPGARTFLDALRPHTVIADTVSLKADFTRLQSLGAEEQKTRLQELARRGDVITAAYIARRLYGGGLADAKAVVEGLQREA